MRNGKAVSLSVNPYEFAHHWWTEERGVFAGQVFKASLNNYENSKDILPNTNIIQVMSRKMIDLIKDFTDDIEVFETIWPDAPDDFQAKDYHVIRFIPVRGYVNIENSIVRRPLASSNLPSSIFVVIEPDFIEGTPGILRPAECSAVYGSQQFYEAYEKNRMSGAEFRAVQLAPKNRGY